MHKTTLYYVGLEVVAHTYTQYATQPVIYWYKLSYTKIIVGTIEQHPYAASMTIGYKNGLKVCGYQLIQQLF